MKKVRVIKIGTACKDRATGIEGVITHWRADMDHYIHYVFQPKGLNPKTKQRLKTSFLELGRLQLPEDCFEEVEAPLGVIGSIATHDATGFTGVVVSAVQHPHGCFHIWIQPPGTLEESGEGIDPDDFALTACSGEKIPSKTPAEKKDDERKKPSPHGDTAFRMPVL